MNLKTIIRFFAAFVISSVTATSALAAQPVNRNWRGLAIKGYDVVAYFVAGKAVEGTAGFETNWSGATWRFASAANRDTFVKAPAKYAPQYGGYCAWAVSQGYTADIDPAAWKIVDGKLYLNYDKKVQKKWEADVPGNIEKADENWPGLVAKK